ncbi:CBS domain-containing protein CBSX5-like [Cucurbita pepo subsp. pepo]|uniref:CBS domain-containing protein CBSX5-like n=1 Tax=Cucurbita pepo subsp. pepo TaxID=3664 RepID=UPI000C9D93E2|nr:CBS domain-containing protein CBSX5-like [Cucurbita pepo subsp. pepo]
MAVRLLAHEVSDICLGKPELRSISVSATLADALSALKRLGENYISVWNCACHSSKSGSGDDCRCVGKISVVDVVSFLCREENLSQPAVALHSSISVIIPEVPVIVRHLQPHASLVEGIDLLLEGAQNLVVPIQTRTFAKSRKKVLKEVAPFDCTLHNNLEYCWLTQEDIIRYLLNSIGLFSPTSITPINSLNAIDTANILAIHYDDPALSALPLLSQAIIHQSAIAIVDSDGKLIGEISPLTLNSCDETLTAAIATLSAGELMAYVDCGDPPEDLVQLVKDRLEERNLVALLEWVEEDSAMSSCSSFYSTSSDDDSGSSLGRSGKFGRPSARQVRSSETAACNPRSSLVAVMIQALAHRVPYLWVVEDDGRLVGIITFVSMLKVFRERLKSMC